MIKNPPSKIEVLLGDFYIDFLEKLNCIKNSNCYYWIFPPNYVIVRTVEKA